MSLYLIQTLAYINQNVYKFGHTTGFKARMGGYDKGSNIIMVWSTFDMDSKQLEKEILKVLCRQFIQRKDAGKEYFEGSLRDIIRTINNCWQELCLERPDPEENPLAVIDDTIFDVDDMSYIAISRKYIKVKIIDREKKTGYFKNWLCNYWLPINGVKKLRKEVTHGLEDINLKNMSERMKRELRWDSARKDIDWNVFADRTIDAILNLCYDPAFQPFTPKYHEYIFLLPGIEYKLLDLKNTTVSNITASDDFPLGLLYHSSRKNLNWDYWFKYPLAYVDKIFKRWIENYYELIPFMKSIFVEFNSSANILSIQCTNSDYIRRLIIFEYIRILLGHLDREFGGLLSNETELREHMNKDNYKTVKYIACDFKPIKTLLNKLTRDKKNIMIVSPNEGRIRMNNFDISDKVMSIKLAPAVLRYVACWPNIDDKKLPGYENLDWSEEPTDEFLTK